jgi:hypothetical protein
MEASKTQYADDISQFSSAGLIIRQKEPTVIFRYQTWIAPLTNYASKVR